MPIFRHFTGAENSTFDHGLPAAEGPPKGGYYPGKKRKKTGRKPDLFPGYGRSFSFESEYIYHWLRKKNLKICGDNTLILTCGYVKINY